MRRLPPPRLLPVTISTIALLLVVKCGILTKALLTDGRYADAAVVTTAAAADHETPVTPASPHGPPLSPPPAAAPVADGLPKPPPPAISDSEKALLQELRQRRRELETREAALAAREAVTGASERKLEERVVQLQALRKALEDMDAARKQKQEAGWQSLVKVYEAMKPRDAATIFNDLALQVLLQVLDRMKDAKAAAVMAAMTPEKAREVTAELAQMRMSREAAPDLSGPQPAAGSSAPQSPKPKVPAQAAAKATPAGG